MTHPSDKELDDYLRRESQVSERYRRLEADDVPPALDAAVLAQARAAVAKPAKSRRRIPAWVRWGSPLALAASAVMIVAIVLEVGVQDELRVPAPQVKQATTQTDTANSVDAVELDAPPAVPTPAVESSESRAVREVVERPIAALTQDAPAFAADPKPVTIPQAASPPLAELKSERARPAADTSDRAPQFSVLSGTGAVPPPAEALERRQAEEVVVTGANIRSESRVSSIAVTASSGDLELKSSDPSRPPFGPRAPGAPRAERASTQDATAEAPHYATPEQWLDAIRKLRVDGKNTEADVEWRAFRRDYPDFEIRAGDAALPEPQR